MVGRKEQRKASRVPIAGGLSGRAKATVDIHILDLSLTGAHIEHSAQLPPGSPCTIELPPEGKPLFLSAQVVWSVLVGAQQIQGGERVLRYHSGLSFIALTADQRRVLASLLEELSAGSNPPESRLSV
jgi:hypothetical protein